MRTRSPSWTHQSAPLACSDPLWKGSRSASLRHRSRPRQCDTSCQKHSSSEAGSSRPRSVLTPQPAKTAPPATQPEPRPAPRDRSRSARRRPPPKRQGPRPKIVLDPAPKASSCSMGQEEGGAKSRGCRANPQAASVEPPSTQFSSGCRGQCVFRSHWARTSAQTAYRSYSGYNKTQTFSKREQISSYTQHEWPVPTWRQTA